MPLPIRPRCRLVSPFRQFFCKLLIDQFISKSNTLLCLSCWYHYLKWFKVIFWLSGAVAIHHNTQLRSWGGVNKYKSLLYFRQLCDSCMSARVFSPFLWSKLFPRSSPNPNECMHERSKSMRMLIQYTSCRDSEIKLTAYSILNDTQVGYNIVFRPWCWYILQVLELIVYCNMLVN